MPPGWDRQGGMGINCLLGLESQGEGWGLWGGEDVVT